MGDEFTPASDIQIGERFFRWRDYTAVPLALIILIFAQPSAAAATFGILLILFGELIRLYSVSFIGTISRTRKDNVGADLVTTGPYKVVRNPLYVGNFFIVSGIATYSGRLWLLLLTLALFAVQYYYIVIYEESILEQRFGEKFSAYRGQTPAWIPNRRALEELTWPQDLGTALRSERNTFAGIVTMLLLLMIFH